MLNRYIQGKKDAMTAKVQKRPFLATDVEDLPEAERWRNQIIREVSKEVTNIQNGSLGEHKIRDLNDKINKLLREKKHWERQIKVLGGPDYEARAPRITDEDGRAAMGTEGYYYFGAARELPGVRELFDKTGEEANKKTRYDLYKMIDADYYGFRDEDDGRLVTLEKKEEKKRRKDVEEKWIETQKSVKRARYKALGLEVPADEEDPVINKKTEGDIFRAHVELPSRAELEQLVLERKKKEILSKYKNKK